MSDSIVNQITGKLLGLAKGATAAVYATVRTIDVDHNALDVAINGALPLPSGAATEAGHLATIDTSTATTATQTTATATNTGTLAGAVNSAAVVVKAKIGTSYSSAAAESSAVISASSVLISQVRAQNLGASTRYLHLFNASALPANGTVPKAVLALATGASGVITFAIPTDRFNVGCVAACSTVQGTLTLSAGADFLIAADIFPAST